MTSSLVNVENHHRRKAKKESAHIMIGRDWGSFHIPGNWVLKFENEKGCFLYLETESLINLAGIFRNLHGERSGQAREN
jgi:hypothetical protein